MDRIEALLGLLSIVGGHESFVHSSIVGRGWANTDTLQLPGVAIVAPRLEHSPTLGLRMLGVLFAEDQFITRHSWGTEEWRHQGNISIESGFLWPFLADGSEEHLLWKGIEAADSLETRTYLLYLQTEPALRAEADTIAATWSTSLEYAGAASRDRRWIIADDFGDVRVWTSRRPDGEWRELACPGNGSYGVTIDAVGDSSAILLWSDGAELHSGIMQADTLSLLTVPNASKGIPGRPRLQLGPGGVHHVFWVTKNDNAFHSRFVAGAWTEPEAISCAYPTTDQYDAASMDISSARGSLPVISWSAASSRTGLLSICVSCPTDSGYPVAEVVPNTNDGFLASPARDENGDVWLAWWKYGDGTYWTHTYTAATVTEAHVEGSPFRRRINWQLSGPAPGSAWSILRASDDTTFAVIGRTTAGAGSSVEWVDSTTTDRTYRYRIRRDCLDRRYELLTETIVSDAAGLTWLPLGLTSASGNPMRGSRQVRVEGAAPGPITVELFDIRGRRVSTISGTAGSSGSVLVDLSPVTTLGPGSAHRTGLYLARARDARGRVSASLKLVIL